MRRYFLPLMILLLLLALSPGVSGQRSSQTDKFTLLTMPYNQRPLTLYSGQFEFNTGYKFSVRAQKYDSYGNKVILKDAGTGSVYHFYFADLAYGVTDYFMIGASANMIRRGVREQSETIVSSTLTTTDRVTVNKLTEAKGLGDMLVFGTLRLPIRYRWFDFSATGGLFIPTAEYQPEKPQNTVTNVTAASSYTVNYRYSLSNGYGVPVYLLSASVKGGYGKFTFEGDFTFKTPKQEGTNIRWEETMVDKVFTYYDKTYQYLLSNAFSVNAAIHFQATGWFDVFMNAGWQKTKGGWTEYYGQRYFNRETRIINLEPGFELKISPSLTIGQLAGFPVSGLNNDAPFYLFTSIRYSFIPFRR